MDRRPLSSGGRNIIGSPSKVSKAPVRKNKKALEDGWDNGDTTEIITPGAGGGAAKRGGMSELDMLAESYDRKNGKVRTGGSGFRKAAPRDPFAPKQGGEIASYKAMELLSRPGNSAGYNNPGLSDKQRRIESMQPENWQGTGAGRFHAARSHERNEEYMDEFRGALDEMSLAGGGKKEDWSDKGPRDGVQGTYSVSRTGHSSLTRNGTWLTGPVDPQGVLIDNSDRPTLCMRHSPPPHYPASL